MCYTTTCREYYYLLIYYYIHFCREHLRAVHPRNWSPSESEVEDKEENGSCADESANGLLDAGGSYRSMR